MNARAPRRIARCTQAEIRRAMRVAELAEKPMAVEILPDGTIRIVPASQSQQSTPPVSERKIVL